MKGPYPGGLGSLGFEGVCTLGSRVVGPHCRMVWAYLRFTRAPTALLSVRSSSFIEVLLEFA